MYVCGISKCSFEKPYKITLKNAIIMQCEDLLNLRARVHLTAPSPVFCLFRRRAVRNWSNIRPPHYGLNCNSIIPNI